QEMFALEEGPVTLTLPPELSATSYQDLADYLAIFLRKAKRRADQMTAAGGDEALETGCTPSRRDLNPKRDVAASPLGDAASGKRTRERRIRVRTQRSERLQSPALGYTAPDFMRVFVKICTCSHATVHACAISRLEIDNTLRTNAGRSRRSPRAFDAARHARA